MKTQTKNAVIRINRYRADGTLYDSELASGSMYATVIRVTADDGAHPYGTDYTAVRDEDQYHQLQYAPGDGPRRDALKGGRMEIFIEGEE